MLNVTGKFVTVFQPEIKTKISSNMLFANLSTSKKNKSNDNVVYYTNMNWRGRFVGNAFEPSKLLKDGDKIDITKGSIENRYDKVNKTQYVDVTIYEFVMSETKKSQKESNEDS
jgi:hypothetical protein